jgi:PAS domain S-box-containing protein
VYLIKPAELLGFRTEELLGKELWQIGLFQDIEASRAAFRQLQDQGYIRYHNLPLVTKAGRRVEVEFVSNLYSVNHQPVIQCNIRDNTEHHQLTPRNTPRKPVTSGLVIKRKERKL